MLSKKKKAEEVPIERMMDEYGNSILRMCYVYLKDQQLAEDAMQDTFIKIYHKYDSFNHQASEKTWVMRIAINTCKNYLKTNWFKKIIVGLKDDEENITSLEDSFLKKEEEQVLMDNILQMSTKYKEVILLYYYQHLKTKEIAQILNISEANVRVRLQRGREQLKIDLEGGDTLWMKA